MVQETMRLFDKYSFRAIYLPTVLILSLPAVNAFCYLNLFDNTNLLTFLGENTNWGSLAWLPGILVYCLGAVTVRTLGRRKQDLLVKTWDGLPTTRFLRFRDNTYSTDLKVAIHNAVQSRFEISMSDKAQEDKDPDEADRKIRQALGVVRSWLRQNDEIAFWQIQNTDYGYYRNLWGSSTLWSTINTVCIFSTGALLYINWYTLHAMPLLILLASDIVFSLLVYVLAVKKLPDATRLSADRYAEAIWMTFHSLAT